MALGADDQADSRGMATADIDNDGDLDIIVLTDQGDHGSPVAPVVLRNDVGHSRRSLVVKLIGVKSNRNAIGASVQLHLKTGREPLTLTRHVQAGAGYASQSDMRLFFGLGNHDSVTTLRVTWPSGLEQQFHGLRTNRQIEIKEGGGMVETPFDSTSTQPRL